MNPMYSWIKGTKEQLLSVLLTNSSTKTPRCCCTIQPATLFTLPTIAGLSFNKIFVVIVHSDSVNKFYDHHCQTLAGSEKSRSVSFQEGLFQVKTVVYRIFKLKDQKSSASIYIKAM